MHEKMRPALGARFSDGHPCMAGTRLSTLQQIMEWSKAKSSTSSFWVYGTAGSGKSTIACTVCEQLRNENTLAGSFFCKRDIPDQRDPRRIMPSLSYTLATKVEPYRDLVLKAIENEPDISNSPLTFQLTTLFITPFATLGEQDHPRQSLLFAIDALDECGDTASRAQLADCLCRIATLSGWLKILVTSRPLPELAQAFGVSHSSTVAPLDLNLISVENDIFLYTNARLEALVGERRLNGKWLGDDLVRELATKASGMFIWTKTVMDFVSARYNSEKAMNAIISDDIKDGSKSSLDALYSSILKMTRGGSGDEEDLTYLKTVLGIICITAKNQPLSMVGLHDFVGRTYISSEALEAIIKDLRSVLYEDNSKGGIIRVCHPSFLDFLGNGERCGEFWTDTEQLQQAVVEKCLIIMRTTLKFDICALETSCFANADIADLTRRIDDHIPESLQYSCLYWATHLTPNNCPAVSRLLMEFFQSMGLLFWLEVLGLIGGLRTGLDALRWVWDLSEVCSD